jgi:phosphopantothenoylcysteine synthetase/decarboxylase
LNLGSASKVTSPNDNNNSIMTNSWIASPPIMRTDQSPSINRSSSPNTHHFNPIENLLIEHASMSVYEQIASRTRSKRHRKTVNDNKLDEQVEEVKDDDNDDDDDDDDDDDRSSVVLQVRLSIQINKL